MSTGPALLAGPDVDAGRVMFRFPDPERSVHRVRLDQEIQVPSDQLDFVWADGVWQLSLELPEVDRVEYLFQLTRADGTTESVTDPSNSRHVAGAFGDKSVVELLRYRPPRWLGQDTPAGCRRAVTVVTREMAEDIDVTIWSPDGTENTDVLPLVVVHDGPEYDELAGLTTYLSAGVTSGDLPRLRAALLPPGPRNDRYSADGAYTRALCLAVVPQVTAEVRSATVIGMGASLGALAMLHAQRQHPSTFAALFLQSGSFFHPRHDAHERRFSQYERVVRSVAAVLRSGGHPSPVPTVMTCGTIEENLHNNRIMARALGAQGYDVSLHEVRDGHNYTAWRDAFDPFLSGLLREMGQAAGR